MTSPPAGEGTRWKTKGKSLEIRAQVDQLSARLDVAGGWGGEPARGQQEEAENRRWGGFFEGKSAQESVKWMKDHVCAPKEQFESQKE